MECPITPVVLFDVLAGAGLVTEDLWRLQLVSRECRDLYRRYVRYRALIMRTIQNRYGLVGAERLDRERSLELIRRWKSAGHLAPFLWEGLITRETVRELLRQGVFSCFTDRNFRLLCRTQGFRPGVYIMCLHACNQNSYAEFCDLADWCYYRQDPSLRRRVWRANRYFRALGRVPLYLRHLMSIAVRPREIDIAPLRKRIDRILDLSLVRDRVRAHATIHSLAQEWYDQEIKKYTDEGPGGSHRLWLQSCKM